MAVAMTWPVDYLWPTTLDWGRDTVAKAGEPALDGGEYPIATDGGGLVVCTMTVELKNIDKAYRGLAWLDRMDGGTRPVIVPVLDLGRQPWPSGENPGPSPHGDGSTFGDGSGYVSQVIKVVVDQAAALRATTLIVRPEIAGPLRLRQCFAITHPTQGRHVYWHTGVEYRGDGTVRLRFRPPLREAVLVDVHLDYDRPSCLMKLSNAGSARNALERARTAKTVMTVSFREHF